MFNGGALLFVTLPLAVSIVIQRRPIAHYMVPRLATELGVVIATGVAGEVVGGDLGPLVALAGLVALWPVNTFTRQCNRAISADDPVALARALRRLEIAWWPLAGTPTTILNHAQLAVLTGDRDTETAALERIVRRGGTPVAALLLAIRRDDRDEIRHRAAALLQPNTPPADAAMAAAALAAHDVPASARVVGQPCRSQGPPPAARAGVVRDCDVHGPHRHRRRELRQPSHQIRQPCNLSARQR